MAKMPTIGPMRDRVALQVVTETKDDMGAPIQSWATLATVWANVEPMSAGEQFRRQQIQSSANWNVTIRYRSGIAPQMRVVFGSRVFQITGVVNPDRVRRFLELACQELAVTAASDLTPHATFDSSVYRFDATDLTWDDAA